MLAAISPRPEGFAERDDVMATQAPDQTARRRQFRWGAGVTAALCAVAVLVFWVAPSHETSGAPGGPGPAEALTSRGYTDAPTGTAVIGGNPWAGGAVLMELRVK